MTRQAVNLVRYGEIDEERGTGGVGRGEGRRGTTILILKIRITIIMAIMTPAMAAQVVSGTKVLLFCSVSCI
jgi:hypothetical protein